MVLLTSTLHATPDTLLAGDEFDGFLGDTL